MENAINAQLMIIEETKRSFLEDVINMEKDLIQFIVKIRNAHNAQELIIEKEIAYGLKKDLRFKRNKN